MKGVSTLSKSELQGVAPSRRGCILMVQNDGVEDFVVTTWVMVMPR